MLGYGGSNALLYQYCSHSANKHFKIVECTILMIKRYMWNHQVLPDEVQPRTVIDDKLICTLYSF